jgi:aryl-alcohol dehydrogenase-like predicted oxidoreductase
MKESEKTIVNRVEEIAKKRGVSMAQVATAWVLSKDGTDFLPGMDIDGSYYGADCWVEFRGED